MNLEFRYRLGAKWTNHEGLNEWNDPEWQTFEGERIRGLKTENEDILVKSYKIDEIKNKLKNGEFLNGLSLIAIQWFFLNINTD